jgi:2-hydroxycyclohexanecarboxyl-CoA dehydrogenase
MDRLKGKVAVISGGGGGIGAATARLFCAEGASVLLVDCDPAALDHKVSALRELSISATVESYRADVGSEQEAQAAIARAIDRFGAVDVLVNNAAIRIPGVVEHLPQTDWNNILTINLVGAANLYRAAARELRKSGRASVVNVSSVYAVTGRTGMGLYDASKAALIALTRTLACEEASHGVRVNAICPGSTLTDYHLKRGAAKGLTPEMMQDETRTDSLFRRWARPEEIAYPILWLASDEASFITGAVLMVDGGLSIM